MERVIAEIGCQRRPAEHRLAVGVRRQRRHEAALHQVEIGLEGEVDVAARGGAQHDAELDADDGRLRRDRVEAGAGPGTAAEERERQNDGGKPHDGGHVSKGRTMTN
ncbi:MAG TPA: hypothetical protein VGL86_25485 [Polyangia bacterium]